MSPLPADQEGGLMGTLRFLLAEPGQNAPILDTQAAFLSNIDGHIFPMETEVQNGTFSCTRRNSDSTKLNIPCHVQGYGQPMLKTCSLREQEAPYLLLLELARGQLSELREHASAWELAGMQIPKAFLKLNQECFQAFRNAQLHRTDPTKSNEYASQALELSMKASDALMASYVQQRSLARRKINHNLPVLLGVEFGNHEIEQTLEPTVTQLFDAGGIGLNWKAIEQQEGEYNWDVADQQVEFCEKHKLVMRSQPLLDFGPDGLPEWLRPWSSDVLNMQSFLIDYVEHVMGKYASKIRLWEVATSVAQGGVFSLSEENRLGLCAKLIEVGRRVDDENQLFVRFDEPFGDYLKKGEHRLSPLQFADALIRSRAGLAGISLHLKIGPLSRRTRLRELLKLSRLIDNWGIFGLPIHVTLTCPSAEPEVDSIATPEWKDHWSEKVQADWTDHILPLLMAKQPVTAVFWSPLIDSPDDIYKPGLVTADLKPKAVCDRLHQFRK